MRAELKSEGQRRVEAPKANLKLRHVFGYRGYDCHSNVYVSQSGKAVYHVAAVGIVLDLNSGTQTHYLKHTDDILALNLHPQQDIVATAQIGRKPLINVWEVDSLETVSILTDAPHSSGIHALDFSGDGKRLVSVGSDPYQTLTVWDWRKGTALASARGHNDRVFDARFSPSDPNRLLSVGVQHVKFWTLAGTGLTHKRGVFGNVGKMETMVCAEWGSGGSGEAFSGSVSGLVYRWKDARLLATFPAHQGPVFSIFPVQTGYLTGGKDGTVALWDAGFTKCLHRYDIVQKNLKEGQLSGDKPAVRAVALGGGVILAGTKHGELLRLEQSGQMILLAQGHWEGEIWGLSGCGSGEMGATVSDDGWLRIWDLNVLLKTGGLLEPIDWGNQLAPCTSPTAD